MNLIDKLNNKCAKQTVIAILQGKSGRYYIGTNWCEDPQVVCPRGDMVSGTGYELCASVCKQHTHAEVDAILQAGDDCFGGSMVLMGHTYTCKACEDILKHSGVDKLTILGGLLNGTSDTP